MNESGGQKKKRRHSKRRSKSKLSTEKRSKTRTDRVKRNLLEDGELEKLEQMVEVKNTALNNWISEKEDEFDTKMAKLYEHADKLKNGIEVSNNSISKVQDDSKEDESLEISLIKQIEFEK